MAWDIEYTNEFGDWWAGLAEGEQDDVTVVVELLADYDLGFGFPTLRVWRAPATATSGSFASRAAAGPYACSTPSTRDGRRFC